MSNSKKDDPYKRENSEIFDFISSSCPNTDNNFDELVAFFWATFSENDDSSIVIDISENN